MPRRDLKRKSTLKLLGNTGGWFKKGKVFASVAEPNPNIKMRSILPTINVIYEVPQRPTGVSAKDKLLFDAKDTQGAALLCATDAVNAILGATDHEIIESIIEPYLPAFQVEAAVSRALAGVKFKLFVSD